MKGKVQDVVRFTGFKCPQGGNNQGYHPRRITQTYARLDNGTDVILDEKEITNVYKRTYITSNFINNKLKKDLIGKEIEYDNRDFLIGPLTNYI